MPAKSSDLLRGAGRFDLDPTRSFTLPARYFVDPQIHELEKEKIFYKTWQYAGPAQELGDEPGSYVTYRVLTENIVIVRGEDGRARAFYNVCRHRAAELVEGKGKSLFLTCPFHGWKYDARGRLVVAPQCEKIANFRNDEFGLQEVQVEKFLNLLFVNLDPAAPSLMSQAPQLDAHYREMLPNLDEMKWTHRFHTEVASNWKSVVENVIENYHTPFTHPGFGDAMELTSFQSTCYDVHVTSVTENIGDVAQPDNEADLMKVGSYDAIFPSTCLAVFPGTPHYLVIHSIPVGPDRTLGTWDFFFRTDPPTASEAAMVKWSEHELNPQDQANLERVQRGMRSRAWSEGRLVVDADHSSFSELPTHFIDAKTLEYLEA